jgi:hypothetical protein
LWSSKHREYLLYYGWNNYGYYGQPVAVAVKGWIYSKSLWFLRAASAAGIIRRDACRAQG